MLLTRCVCVCVCLYTHPNAIWKRECYLRIYSIHYKFVLHAIFSSTNSHLFVNLSLFHLHRKRFFFHARGMCMCVTFHTFSLYRRPIFCVKNFHRKCYVVHHHHFNYALSLQTVNVYTIYGITGRKIVNKDDHIVRK